MAEVSTSYSLPDSLKTLNTCLVCVALFLICSLLLLPNQSYYGLQNDGTAASHSDTPEIYNLAVPTRPVSRANFMYLSMKTSYKFHTSRILPLLQTWIPVALALKDGNDDPVVPRVSIITDSHPDGNFKDSLDKLHKVIVTSTDCGITHRGVDLCCKMNREFRQYYHHSILNPMPKWFCHFDDDAYVNPDILYSSLLQITETHNEKAHLYVGKRSIKYGFNMTDAIQQKRVNVVFANGDAYCLNDVMMLRIRSSMVIANDPLNFKHLSKKHYGDIGDDVLLAFLLTAYFNATYVELPNIYSHTYTDLPNTKWTDACEAVAVCQSKSNYLHPTAADGYNGTSWVNLTHKQRVVELHNLCRVQKKDKRKIVQNLNKS